MRAFAAAVAAAIAVGVCGCGEASPPAATDVRPVAALLSPSAWAKAQARALARHMLAAQPLPPQAQPLRADQPRPRSLRAAETIGGGEPPIDIARVFRVRLPEREVVRFFKTHTLAGSANLSYGHESSGRTVEEFVGYALTSMPPGVCGPFFVASMLPGPRGTWLRTDAQVVWCLPRSAAEHIDPAEYQAVVVASVNLDVPPVTKRFTSGRVIAELARKLNAMPVSRAAGDFCPAFAGGYRLTFRPRPGSARRVTVTAEPCDGALVTVGGRRQPLLADTTGLGALVDRLLGVR